MLQPNIEKRETVDLTFGSACYQCLTSLKAFDPQFYCYFCKIWFCKNCGEDDKFQTRKGSKRMVHPHNLVWINVFSEEGMHSIDTYKFGKNLDFDVNIQKHGGICNGCGMSTTLLEPESSTRIDIPGGSQVVAHSGVK